MNNTEIERKWLLSGFPALPPETETAMEQAYLCFEPCTVRVRKTEAQTGVQYMLCIKGRGTLTRTEVETPLSQEQYQALLALAPLPPVKKLHRTYRLPGGEVAECNLVDEGHPQSFYYAEVEFENLQQAAAFLPPAFFGREVTEEPGWTMAAYCRRRAAAIE